MDTIAEVSDGRSAYVAGPIANHSFDASAIPPVPHTAPHIDKEHKKLFSHFTTMKISVPSSWSRCRVGAGVHVCIDRVTVRDEDVPNDRVIPLIIRLNEYIYVFATEKSEKRSYTSVVIL